MVVMLLNGLKSYGNYLSTNTKITRPNNDNLLTI